MIWLQWGRDQLIAELGSAADGVGQWWHASMGPRSIDRGTSRKTLIMPRDFVLQWGRDQLIAELFRPRLSACHTVKLQWGRDQLIAETSAAVMSQVTTNSRLQWGRDQLIAELNMQNNFATGLAGFNGAAIN